MTINGVMRHCGSYIWGDQMSHTLKCVHTFQNQADKAYLILFSSFYQCRIVNEIHELDGIT